MEPTVVTPANVRRAWIGFDVTTPEEADKLCADFRPIMEEFNDQHHMDEVLRDMEHDVHFDPVRNVIHVNGTSLPLPARVMVDTYNWEEAFVEKLAPPALNPVSTHLIYSDFLKEL